MTRHDYRRRALRRPAVAALSAALTLGGLTAAGAQTAAIPLSAGQNGTVASDVSGGDLEWGLRTSYRNYIAGPIAHGEIITSGSAVWLDGPGHARGTFSFPNATGSLDADTGIGHLAFDGQVYTGGHDYGDGPILELTISNVRLNLDGDEGTLIVDAEYRPFVGANPNIEPPPVETATDMAFGRVDLRGADLTPDEDGVVSVAGAPVTGVREAMEAIGWDLFYSGELPNIQLDPLSFTATVEDVSGPDDPDDPDDPSDPDDPDDPEPPMWEPAVEVFAADGETPLADTEVMPGDDVVVRGSGFDPDANESTRPPVPTGLPAGVYVVFGKFADVWRPSQGAPSSSRHVIDQRWAMTQDTLDAVPDRFKDSILEQHVALTPEGTFEATLTVDAADDIEGGHGVYTYAAGGAAANPAHEIAVAVSVGTGEDPTDPDPEPTVSLSKTADLDPYADIVTVTGAGFLPEPLADGLQVGVGPVTDDGTVPDLDPATTLLPGDDEIKADGSFEVDLRTEQVEPGVTLAVYTAPVDASAPESYRTSTEIWFAPARTPELSVEPTDNLEVDDEVRVTGSGFAPNRKISIAITSNTSTHETHGWPTGWLGHGVVQADADGNLERTFTVTGTVTGSGEDCGDLDCYVASFSSAQVGDATPVDYRADRSQDVFVPISFAVEGTDPDSDPDPDPRDPSLTISPETVERGQSVTFAGIDLGPGETASVVVTTEADAATEAALDWGVRQSFRNYIEGNIAHGSIDVRAPASRNADGTFRFADGHGTATAETADLVFSGEVRFAGHDYGDGPLLQMTISEPRVIAEGDAGVLVADVASKSLDSGEIVDYPAVELAELDFSDAPLTINGAVISASGVTATLTDDGVPAFADFYEAGTVLDPIGFTATLAGGSETEAGSGVVDDNGAVDVSWAVPDDFPVGTSTATMTAGDDQLSGQFTVEPAGGGGDENDGDDGGDAGGADESGKDSGADDGTANDTDDGSGGTLPDTGAGAGVLLWVAGLLALGGLGVAALIRRRGWQGMA